MFKTLKFWWEEAKWAFQQDPSTTSTLQAFFLLPGIRARRYHTVSHWLYQHRHFFIARWVSEKAKFKTGIDIHPGAQLGKYLFIDHGTGVVIGETAIIGDRVTIFHGVTLGGTGKDKGVKRHPTVESDVILGAGSTVLGDITIGQSAKVGAGAVVLKSVPSKMTAVGIPAKFYQVKETPENCIPPEWFI